MDLYLALKNDGDPSNLPELMGLDFDVIGPDYNGGYVLEGSEGVITAALEALLSLNAVRFYVIL